MSKRIKLLRIAAVPNDRRGGMSRTMHLTGAYLQEDGFDVRYVFQDGFRWRLHRGMARFTQPWEAGLRMAQAIREWGGCDLVEVHEPLTPGCVWARRRFPFCRVIGFSYGLEERSRSAMLSYRDKHGIRTPLKGRLTSLLQGWHSGAGLRGCDHVICSNKEDITYLVSKGVPQTKLTRHFSGVDEFLLQKGEQSFCRNAAGILFLGAWIDRKGTPEVVASLTQLLRNRQEVSFTAAGCQIPKEEVLRAFPADIRDRVHVIRHVESEQELASLYGSHSIFLLPSYFEGQPLVMIEAAAFGMAVVTTPVSGMLDFIRDGDNGLFVPVGDADGCVSAIHRLLDDPALAQRMGVSARQSVISHTWRESAKNLAQAYRSVYDQADLG